MLRNPIEPVRIPYICARCTRQFATSQRRNVVPTGRTLRPRRITTQRTSHHAYSTAAAKKPFRVAIIGSGPAGFYTAYRLMTKVPDAVVDMYEQLPVPYGLARFGVAPDHPEVKNCQDKFEEVAQSSRFNYIGNVEVGRDVDLLRMKPHYDAMLFSYGASEDKKLGVPGEESSGIWSAREFVGWYNGLPQFQDRIPGLENASEAIVIGQGNVALDVARILLTPVDRLRHTDITSQALDCLSRNKIRSVTVVGRRGPLQASFTVKEARELMHIPGVAFRPLPDNIYPSNIKTLPRIQKRIGEVLLKGTSQRDSNDVKATWALDFFKSPTSFQSDGDGRLHQICFDEQVFAPDQDPLSPSAKVISSGRSSVMPTDLCFRSVGYKSTALPGLEDISVPFDAKLGIIPNDPFGRIVSPTAGPGSLSAGHVPGTYSAGWVKRGPTGVIASTMEDAFTSADAIASDWASGVPFLNTEKGEQKSTGLGWDGVREHVLAKGVRPLSWNDWKVIDRKERDMGKKLDKEREKFTSVKEMLKALDA